MSARAIRGLLSVVIGVLIAVAVVLLVRQFVVFSAQIEARPWAHAIEAVAGHLVLPFGVRGIRTPYGGVFDADNALTIVIALLAEWALSVVRDRV